VEDAVEAQHGYLYGNEEGIEHSHKHEHGGPGKLTHLHRHAKSVALSLWGIGAFAFVLGFVHEEEFALLAMFMAGDGPLILMISYASAVAIALIAVTLSCVKAYRWFSPKIERFQKQIPRMTAISLLLMVVALLFGLA